MTYISKIFVNLQEPVLKGLLIESVNYIILRRDEELTSVFLRLLGDGRLAKDVISHAASLPCSRFWLSPDNAQRYVGLRLRGLWGNKGNELKMQVKKIDEIIRRCDGDYSLKKITEVVESPAPCFYLERGSAINIVFKTLKKRRERKCRM